MKNKNILTLVLLFVMSFQVVHAFAIDMLDTHQCQVSEYVDEFSPSGEHEYDGDVCSIHAGFHHSFLIPQNLELIQRHRLQEQPYSHLTSYEYDATKTFLIPPRLV